MRRIGTIASESEARRFGDYLLVNGIDNQVEADDDEAVIWVHSEDKVPDAKERFARFVADPNADEFAVAAREARSIRSEREKAAAKSRARTIDVRTTWGTRGIAAAGPVTRALVIFSVGVAILEAAGAPTREWLMMGPLEWVFANGQVWRLFTPIFVHFGILHLVFNMYWTWQFGGMIEYQLGSRRLGALVVLTSLGSNMAQYAIGGLGYGGMSGVVYALFGYIWIRSRYDSGAGLAIAPSTVQFLMFWFLLCWLPFFPMNIANWAHAGGLAVGAAWGYVDSGRLRR